MYKKNKKKKYNIAAVGEILWDIFPNGKKLGGAPANFTYYIKQLGHYGTIISKIGRDVLGKEIIKSLHELNLSTNYIQVDPVHPTGTVDVILKSKSEPKYVIRENVAWDFIEMNNKLKIFSKEVDVVYFGSLAQRNPISRSTIINFLNSAKQDTLIVFDINLRRPFFTKEIIVDSLKLSSILKINDKELLLLRKLLDYRFDNNELDFLKLLIKRFKIDLICLTKGKSGSLLVTRNNYFLHPGFKVKVSDTVGSGDAFTAAMVIEFLNRKSLGEISEAANKLGSWVTSKFGATIKIDDNIKEKNFGFRRIV